MWHWTLDRTITSNNSPSHIKGVVSPGVVIFILLFLCSAWHLYPSSKDEYIILLPEIFHGLSTPTTRIVWKIYKTWMISICVEKMVSIVPYVLLANLFQNMMNMTTCQKSNCIHQQCMCQLTILILNVPLGRKWWWLLKTLWFNDKYSVNLKLFYCMNSYIVNQV